MKKYLKFSSMMLGVVSTLLVASVSYADESVPVTLRVEPGVAVPLTNPQTQRFDVGGAVAVKPEVTLSHYLGVGPSFQVMALPSKIDGIETGAAWSYGGFVRVKRPHDELNTGNGWSAVSPWVDLDLKYVRTDPLDRFGVAAAVGAQVPTSDSRWLWVGPFARYDVVNQNDKVGYNSNSAKTLILGVSFEFGAPVKKKTVETHPDPEPLPLPVVEKKPEPPVETTQPPVVVRMEFKPRIQFAWDSAELEPVQLEPLRDVVRAMLADVSYNVKISGHASSEGQVEHNNKLSMRRAQSVADFLVANGVERHRLTVEGFGSRVPVADNKTEEGRVANRRVEFDVTFVLVKEGN